jgi:hypothetical protein
MWEEGGCLIEDLVRKQGKDQICKTCCLAQQHPELTRYSIFGDSSSEKIIPSLIHLDCVNGCQKCGVENTFPKIRKCPVFFNQDLTQNGEGGERTLYRCKVWKAVNIARTTKMQKELVEEKMTISELIDHYLKCITDARSHYVKYKIVDWCQSTFKFNTTPEHGRIVIYTDFAANPNLSAIRTATGAVDTHAALAIFISYQYTRMPDGMARCTKKSHQFIGSAESAGKKTNWMFHNACLKFLVAKLARQLLEEQGIEIREILVMTDRCPGQYLCRQNMLQLAKFSVGSEQLWEEKLEEDGDEDVPLLPNGFILNHSFAVRY